jgi:hypothetical protein
MYRYILLISKFTKMLNKNVIYEALKSSLTAYPGQDSTISLLIHDVFGGEILKTHNKKKWYFYNRIDGERVDFTLKKKSTGMKVFEDIPATPDETYDYIDQVDYSTFFMKFIRAFEETVGLEKYRTHLSN